MEAIILAAGRGNRLKSTELPKCLVQINDRELLDYQLSNLVSLNCPKVTICIGYQGQLIRDYVTGLRYPLHIEWVENKDYLDTNNSYSLYLVFRENTPNGGFMVINGDNLIDPRVYQMLYHSPVSVLPYVRKNRYDFEDMKITYDKKKTGNFLNTISKNIPSNKAHGESLGIRSFVPPFSGALIDELSNLVSTEKGKTLYFTEAIQRAVDLGYSLKVQDVTSYYCAEVDFDKDIRMASKTASRIQVIS